MKKHYCIQSFRAKSVLMRCMKKIPLAMRCALFMLFCLVGMTFANEGYAQKTMVNITLENKTVDEVLTELEQGTEFVFYYQHPTDMEDVPDRHLFRLPFLYRT